MRKLSKQKIERIGAKIDDCIFGSPWDDLFSIPEDLTDEQIDEQYKAWRKDHPAQAHIVQTLTEDEQEGYCISRDETAYVVLCEDMLFFVTVASRLFWPCDDCDHIYQY